jgi:hypothetical protein
MIYNKAIAKNDAFEFAKVSLVFRAKPNAICAAG